MYRLIKIELKFQLEVQIYPMDSTVCVVCLRLEARNIS